MLDWNHDGKIDYKDYAFYNNVVESGMKGSENFSRGNDIHKKSSTTSSSAETNRGAGIFIGICILCLIIKLMGG